MRLLALLFSRNRARARASLKRLRTILSKQALIKLAMRRVRERDEENTQIWRVREPLRAFRILIELWKPK
jgi:hypothetical protein